MRKSKRRISLRRDRANGLWCWQPIYRRWTSFDHLKYSLHRMEGTAAKRKGGRKSNRALNFRKRRSECDQHERDMLAQRLLLQGPKCVRICPATFEERRATEADPHLELKSWKCEVSVCVKDPGDKPQDTSPLAINQGSPHECLLEIYSLGRQPDSRNQAIIAYLRPVTTASTTDSGNLQLTVAVHAKTATAGNSGEEIPSVCLQISSRNSSRSYHP